MCFDRCLSSVVMLNVSYAFLSRERVLLLFCLCMYKLCLMSDIILIRLSSVFRPKIKPQCSGVIIFYDV